jgi:hypothetical protein
MDHPAVSRERVAPRVGVSVVCIVGPGFPQLYRGVGMLVLHCNQPHPLWAVAVIVASPYRVLVAHHAPVCQQHWAACGALDGPVVAPASLASPGEGQTHGRDAHHEDAHVRAYYQLVAHPVGVFARRAVAYGGLAWMDGGTYWAWTVGGIEMVWTVAHGCGPFITSAK